MSTGKEVIWEGKCFACGSVWVIYKDNPTQGCPKCADEAKMAREDTKTENASLVGISYKQCPSVGRLVHYVQPQIISKVEALAGVHAKPHYHLAAIIVAVQKDGSVCLTVFSPEDTSLSFTKGTPYSENPDAHTWHWPERV